MTSSSQERDAPIELVAYDPVWPLEFLREKALLEQACGPWLCGPIQHVGSTAIAGMLAKPVIDIMLPVESLESSIAAIPAAESLHYHYWPYKAELMRWFCKPSPAHRTHHLHMVPMNSQLWHARLIFRDALRENSQLAREYAELKRGLAARFPDDREAYTEGKADFVQSVLRASERLDSGV